jgi:hypothetical protein
MVVYPLVFVEVEKSELLQLSQSMVSLHSQSNVLKIPNLLPRLFPRAARL